VGTTIADTDAVTMSDSVVACVALTVGLIACITDVRSRRIPNVLTFGAAGAALLFHGVEAGASGLMTAVAGWLVGVVLFLPFFLLRGMGGGDVKLLAALGAWLGPGDAFWLAIYTSLAGGVMGIAVAFARGYLQTALRNVWRLLVSWSLTGPQAMPTMTLEDSKAPRLAYALPLFVGTMVTVWLR
jgi:prepilin peptidase CpaA